MEMGTALPRPIKSARAKLMMTRGIARLNPAKAVSPKMRLMKMPSATWYRAEASIPIEPGMAALKNSWGRASAKNSVL